MPIHSTSWAFIPLGGYPKEAAETCQGKNARFIEEIGSSGGGCANRTPPPVEDDPLKLVNALRKPIALASGPSRTVFRRKGGSTRTQVDEFSRSLRRDGEPAGCESTLRFASRPWAR